MYDRTIRRRRAALALLVAAALILITASFGDRNATGAFGALQRGIGTVVSPVENGVSRAFGPVRNLFHWMGNAIHAGSRIKAARTERDRWEAQAVGAQANARRIKELEALLALRDTPIDLAAYAPVTGRVIARAGPLYSDELTIDLGSGDGVRAEMPVVASGSGGGAGLIGKVTAAHDGYSQVTLLTSGDFAVGAKSLDGRTTGDLKASGGAPGDLVLTSAQLAPNADVGTVIVTAGTVANVAGLKSLYPSDIPIGRISRIDNLGSVTERAHVRLFASPRQAEYVQVLTRVGGAAGQ